MRQAHWGWMPHTSGSGIWRSFESQDAKAGRLQDERRGRVLGAWRWDAGQRQLFEHDNMLNKVVMYIDLLFRHYCLTNVLSHDIPKLQEKPAKKRCIYPSMTREITAKQSHLDTSLHSHLQARPIDTVTSRLHTSCQPGVEASVAKDHPFTL